MIILSAILTGATLGTEIGSMIAPAVATLTGISASTTTAACTLGGAGIGLAAGLENTENCFDAI